MIQSYKKPLKYTSIVSKFVGCWLCLTSHRQHSHLLPLTKTVKLSFYTVPIGNRTPGRRMAVHYTTATLSKEKFESNFYIHCYSIV